MSTLPPPPPPERPAPPPPGLAAPPPAEPAADERPDRHATVPVTIAALLTLLVGGAAFMLVTWARGGTGCEASDFESTRFGYCARTPAGWIAVPAGKGITLDRFMIQDGPATITVIAVPLTRGQDLTRFEQFVRADVEAASATAGSSSKLEVDGVEAIEFDVTLEGADGVVRSREVLFVREGVAWRVTLADEEVGFEASTRHLGELLASWRFT